MRISNFQTAPPPSFPPPTFEVGDIFSTRSSLLTAHCSEKHLTRLRPSKLFLVSPLLTPGSDVSFYTGILQTDISMVFYFFRIVNSHSLEESRNFLRVKKVCGFELTCGLVLTCGLLTNRFSTRAMPECFEQSRVLCVWPNLGWLGPNVKRFVRLSKCAITPPNLETSDAPPVCATPGWGGRY